MQRFFYLKNGQSISGPFSEEQIRNLAEKHLIETCTEISENKVVWQPYSALFVGENMNDHIEDEAPETPFQTDEADIQPDVMQRESEENKPVYTEKEQPESVPCYSGKTDPVFTAQKIPFVVCRALDTLNSEDGSHPSFLHYFMATILLLIVVHLLAGMILFSVFLPERLVILLLVSFGVFAGMVLLLLIENILLTIHGKQGKIIEVYSFFTISAVMTVWGFYASFPCIGLCGQEISRFPVWLTVVAIAFASLSAIYGVVQLFRGTCAILKIRFGVLQKYASLFAILACLQWIAIIFLFIFFITITFHAR